MTETINLGPCSCCTSLEADCGNPSELTMTITVDDGEDANCSDLAGEYPLLWDADNGRWNMDLDFVHPCFEGLCSFTWAPRMDCTTGETPKVDFSLGNGCSQTGKDYELPFIWVIPCTTKTCCGGDNGLECDITIVITS